MTHIDPEKDKQFGPASAERWLLGHQSIVYQFVNERFRKEDQTRMVAELSQDRVWFTNFLYVNYVLSEQRKIEEIREMVTKEGTTTLMLGSMGGGKTASIFWLMESLIKDGWNKNLYWFGYNPEIDRLYKGRIQQTMNVESCNNGLLVIDEALVFFGGQFVNTREVRDRLITFVTQRHRNIATLFIAQAIRTAGQILDTANNIWFKPFSAIKGGFFDTERSASIRPEIRLVMPSLPSQNVFYNIQSSNAYMFSNGLADRWNESLSKPYSLLRTKEEAERFYRILEESEFTGEKEMARILRQRGWKLEDLDV